MRNLIQIYRFSFFIVLLFFITSQSFANNPAKKPNKKTEFNKSSKIKSHKKSTKSIKRSQNKTNIPKSLVKKDNNKNTKSKIKESQKNLILKEDIDDDFDNFDYERFYRNANDNSDNQNNSDTQYDNNSDINDEFSDFGIIKDTIKEKNVIKKYDSEEDEIFLNKDIFDEKIKIELRNSIPQESVSIEPKLKIHNRIISDLSFTDNYGNPQNNFYDTNASLRYYSNIILKKNFEFYGLFRFSRIDNRNDIEKRRQDRNGGGSRIFENMGIGISELSFKYSKNNNSIILGKFTANFGTAWRWNKAIVLHTIAQNYALSDKLGISLIKKYGDLKKAGLYNFSLSFFTNDRKNLNKTLIHQKEEIPKSETLAGDTRNLSSYVFATDISFDFGAKEKLNYHISYSRLAVNRRLSSVPGDLLKKQQGMVIGMNYEFPINREFSMETILENANIKNPNGDSRILNNYLTTNFIIKYRNNYSLMIGNSRNKNKNLSLSNTRNNIFEINLGYEFNKNKYFDKLTTQFGYYQKIQKLSDNSTKNKALSFLIRYYKNF